MYVMDSFGLPVEATETRVNAGREADDYMFAHLKKSKQVARAEGICGWYHSHPGYGCWLSGIDVNTQQNYQQIQDPAIAIVIDPKRTIAAGKVEIGCFRAYKNDHAEKILQNYKQQTGSAIIPGEKFNEFGLHAHKYYKLEHTFFKSGLDTTLLERLWNEYWVHTLASSPLLSNQDIICKSVINIADKLSQIQASKSTQRGLLNSGSENKLIEEEKFAPLAAEGSKVALGVSQGIIVEALKKFMFACQPHDHAICCKQEADVQMAEEQKE